MFGIVNKETGKWVSKVSHIGSRYHVHQTNYYTKAKQFKAKWEVRALLERANLEDEFACKVIPETEYEGFTNYSTWLAATCIDNNKELYDVIQAGLDVVARRFKGGNPNKSSHPFITTHEGFGEHLTPLVEHVLADTKAGLVQYCPTMCAHLTTTFIYNELANWIDKHLSKECTEGYPEYELREICTKDLTEHILNMYFDTAVQVKHYAKERK